MSQDQNELLRQQEEARRALASQPQQTPPAPAPATPSVNIAGQTPPPAGQPTRVEPVGEESQGRLPAGAPGAIRTADIQPADRITRQPTPGFVTPGPIDPGATGSALVNSGATNLMPMETIVGQPPRLQPGIGPRLVVLDTAVFGPGGGPYVRGQVINASHILGEARLRVSGNQQADRENGLWATTALKRYLDLKSVREATPEEAGQDFVQLLEGEPALANALETETARRVAAERERNEMAQRVAELERQLGQRQFAPGGGQGESAASL